jgi:methyltransferase-like protein 6
LKVLKPGGLVFFRDYAVGDEAQHRFAGQEDSKKKLAENFYVRQDGTRAYFFTKETVRLLFERNGFEVLESEYIKRQVENKKRNLQMNRIWVQGKFRKCGVSTLNILSLNTNADDEPISYELHNTNAEATQINVLAVQ